MSAYVIDTETTSTEPDREVIEAAWIYVPSIVDLVGHSDRIIDGVFVQRYKPSRRIGLGAMAVHHIVPDDLAECPPSSECALPDNAEYVIGHNVDFDVEALGSPTVKRICTLAISRYVWPDVDAYSQTALLYHLLGATPETRDLLRNAHSAAVDVINNVVLLEKILEAKPEITTWSQLYAYSEQCRIPRVMPIGEKQGVKGLTLDEAVDYDPGFCEWCLRQAFIDEYLKTGLRQAFERANQR